jgi:hypothetical protein
MAAFAGMLIGWYFLEQVLRDLPPVDPLAEAAAVKEAEARRDEVVRWVTGYWIVALLVLLAIIFLAAFDLLATARFGLRQQRLLEAERHAMLEAQAMRLRKERNGHR